MNLSVAGNGCNKFDAVQELNGLDVLRRIVVPLAPKTVARCVEMYSIIHSPVRCKHIGEMSDHIEAWERKIDDFAITGGPRLNDPEIGIIALNLFSADTPASLVLVLEGRSDYATPKMMFDKHVTFLSG